MANLLGQNIGTNYKGILNLDSTINTPLDATLRAVTDGEGNASPLQLSTDAVSIGAISGARLGIKGSGITSATTSLLVQNSANVDIIKAFDNGSLNIGFTTNTNNPYISMGGIYAGTFINAVSQLVLRIGGTDALKIDGNGNIGIGNPTIAANTKLHIKGSGTTSATTSLLVQNSAGTDLIRLNDLGLLQFGGTTNAFPAFKRVGSGLELKSADDTSDGEPIFTSFNIQVKNMFFGAGALTFGYAGGTVGFKMSNVGASSFGVGVTDAPASAQLEVRSTTKGFLPPRMTTTQKNAIATPASGLIVYDETTNKLACYNGTTWNDLF